MTPSKEDYISSIFKQMERSHCSSNKEIAQYLKISKASVSEMIQKLIEEGFVQTRGREITLTDKGMEMAKRTVSIHRLWETFLEKELHFPQEEIHSQADLLEHATTEKLMKALNEYLNKPKTCPHGGRIYLNETK